MHVTERQMQYLRTIARLRNCGVRELSRAMRVRPTAATEAVRRLQRHGLVSRRAGSHRAISITHKGHALQEPVWIAEDAYEAVWWCDD